MGDDREPREPAAARREHRPADPVAVGLTTAVAAGVFVARWWLLRRGTLLAAAGLGLGVGLLGVVGGPAARTAVAVLAAAADVLGATDASGPAPPTSKTVNPVSHAGRTAARTQPRGFARGSQPGSAPSGVGLIAHPNQATSPPLSTVCSQGERS
ncbi:hypothetical protein [Fimbriiglobus ruber]|uniref:Uncharacterized protein n=1 Tax=Fimbriiglobus ruber TaxID=1908690 RepID=A0A225DEJ3_9BACT|nr:hypothetical protein [Fimbriiglobus ruber]OWK35766.1 hypothetical protein FRUB_08329 [Fimbriiglobus ruber]